MAPNFACRIAAFLLIRGVRTAEAIYEISYQVEVTGVKQCTVYRKNNNPGRFNGRNVSVRRFRRGASDNGVYSVPRSVPGIQKTRRKAFEKFLIASNCENKDLDRIVLTRSFSTDFTFKYILKFIVK